jgi:hypothetical protein
MHVGRAVVLASLFLGFVFAIMPAQPVRAKPPAAPGPQQAEQSHQIWLDKLTPEEIASALKRLGRGEDSEQDRMIQKALEKWLENAPRLTEQQKELLRNKVNDPAFLEMAKELAEKHRIDPGRPGKLSPEDLAKLAPLTKGTPFDFKGSLPENPGPVLPTIPKEPPPIEPGKGLPPVPEIRPPSLEGPEPNPKGRDPLGKLGQSIDQDLFKTNPEPLDPRKKSLEAFAALWERNIGPLEETPEVKRALFDLVSGAQGLDFDLKDERGNSFWDFLKDGSSNGSSFSDLLKGGEGMNWRFGKLDMPSLGWGKWWNENVSGSSSSGRSNRSLDSPRMPRTGGLGSGSWGTIGGVRASWLPMALLALIVVGAFIWWRYWYIPRAAAAGAGSVADGLGPWPVDPRRINSREDVVKAFEYLSVLICGPTARTWTHGTIAEALARLAATHDQTAMMLARLYELARYAPLEEPLTAEELLEARQLVCALAGVPA